MAGEAFKIFGSIFLSDKEVNNTLDRTSKGFNDTFNNAVQSGTKFASAIGQTMTKVGTVMLGVSTAIGAGAVKMFMPYQESVAKISTLVSDEDLLGNIKKDMITLSNELGIDATKLGDAIYQGLSSGVSPDKVTEFTGNMAKLAKGGLTEVATATDLTTTILNSYGLEMDQTTRIMDVLINTQNRGKTTVNELGANMGKVIPTANAYGVELEQLAAGYAIMTAKGVATAETTTYMNSMFNEMGKSGTKASDVIKKLSGKSFKELMESGKSVGDVLAIMESYARKNNLSLSDLFGSAEAGKAALLLATEGGEAFNKELLSMKNSTGEAEKAFNKMDDTLKSKIDKAITKVKNSFIKLGEALLPVVEGKIVPAIESFANWISNLDEKTIENMASWVEWGVKIGGALIIGGKLLSWGSNMVSSFTTISTVLSGTTTATGALASGVGGLGGAMALLTNPVTLVATGLLALGGAFIYSQSKLNESTEEFVNGANKLEDFDGKVRTSESLWTSVFGKKYKFQLSEDFEEHKNEVSDISDNVITIFQETQTKIGDILSQDLPLQQQQEQIQEHYDEMYRKLQEQWDRTNLQNDENYNRNYITLAGHLNTQTELEQSTKDSILEQYDDFYLTQQTKVNDNNTQIEQIYRTHLDAKGQLTSEGQEKINTLLDENHAISETLTQTNAENIIQILNRHNLEKETLYGKDVENVKRSDLDKIQSAKDWSAKTKEELDLSRQNMLEFTKGNAEETAKVNKQFDDLESNINSFSSDYVSYLDKCVKGGMSYEQATKEAMNNVIRKAEETGGSVPDSLANIIQAMVDSGASADDLTEAIKAIPSEVRSDVLAKVEGKDNVDTLKQAIDRVQSKKVFITAEHRMTGNTMYAKGTEGVMIKSIPKRAFGEESFKNTQTALVGEQGPELVELPQGAKVKTHRETNNATNDKPQIIQLICEGRILAEVMAPFMGNSVGVRQRQEAW